MHYFGTLSDTLSIRRWHCEYGPEDHSHIVKNITSTLLPRGRKKLTIPKISAAIDSISPGNFPAKNERPSRKRKPPRKFKANTAVNLVTLDLNVEPRPHEETVLKPRRRKPMAEEPLKPVQKRVPKIKTNKVAPDCQRCTQCTEISDVLIDVPQTPTGTLPLSGVIGKSLPHSEGCNCIPISCRAPWKKKLPDLNKSVPPPKSPKKPSIPRKTTVPKIINKPKSRKEGKSMFQGLGSLVTALSKNEEGKVANITVGVVPSQAPMTALLDGTDGANVFFNTMDKPSVIAFPSSSTSVVDTTKEQTFFGAELNYLHGNPNHSISDASECTILHSVDSTLNAESFVGSNIRGVHSDSVTSIIGACAITEDGPRLHDDNMEGVHSDSATKVTTPCVLNDKISSSEDDKTEGKQNGTQDRDVLPATKERDSRKKWGLSIKRGCTARFTMKSLLHAPHISEICIFQSKHVNKDGLVVHGGMKAGDRGAFSAHLSPIVKEFVDECLH